MIHIDFDSWPTVKTVVLKCLMWCVVLQCKYGDHQEFEVWLFKLRINIIDFNINKCTNL